MHIESYSNASVIDLKKSNRNANGVLNALRINPRIIIGDLIENPWLVNIIEKLVEDGHILEVSEPFPCIRYSLTKSGIDFITI